MTTRIRATVVFLSLAVAVLLAAATPTMASHGRFGHLTWNPRPDISPNTIELTSKVGFRRSAFGALQVGNMVNLAGSATILWGDGGQANPLYEVLSVDIANDWFLAEARGVLHTYPAPSNGANPWIAQISTCCRIYQNRNAPGTSYAYQTTVDLRVVNSSPRSTAPAIVNMAVNAVNSILIPVAEPDGDAINCRFATPAESGISFQPGPPVSGPANSLTVATVAGGCQVSWNTTGTAIGELWALQIAIEDRRGGTTLGRAGLEFLIRIVADIGEPPVCDVPPTPTGTTNLADNTAFAATIQGSDPDAGETLVLNSTGVPSGAVLTPTLPRVGSSPISVSLTWTPSLLDLGPQPFVFTVTDSNNLQALCSFTLNVIFDPFGGITETPTRNTRGTLRRPPPPSGGGDNPIEGGRCVETTDPDCDPPSGPTPDCEPDFTGVPVEPFPADEDELDFEIVLSDGEGSKTVCCELIDDTGGSLGPFCQTIELVTPECDVASIACPADVTGLECPASTDPADTGSATVTGDCAAVSITSDDVVTPGCGGTATITRTWTASDGTNTASCVQSISTVDTTPPDITVPAAIVEECNSTGGVLSSDPAIVAWLASATASDACSSASVGDNAPGLFPVGTTDVTFVATDACNNATSGVSQVTVQDTVPPQISVSLTPATLWPPNHRMIDIGAIVTVTDVCTASPAVFLASATSNEADNANGTGDGNTVNDIQGVDVGTPDTTLQLRAERDGTGNGRVYTVTYTVVDASGNQTSGSDVVLVPHDQGGATDPVALAVVGTAGGSVVEWAPVPGALYYNVVRGLVSNLGDDGTHVTLGALTCVASQSQIASTSGSEDFDVPPEGEVFFYLVEYNDGWASSYGTEIVPLPRAAPAGVCE